MFTNTRKSLIALAVAAILFLSAGTYKDNFFEIAKQIEIFTTLFKELNMNYVDEVNPAELMDTAIKEMLDELDPYTVFMNEQDVEDARIRSEGEYSGIGALIKNKAGRLLVVEPFKDYPADMAGLKAGDEIIQIGTTRVSEVEEDPGMLLKGAPNSAVELTYLRQGKTYTTKLIRKDIEVNPVPFYRLTEGNIGYIVLTEFNQKASDKVADAIRDLKLQGASKLILDLRSNPGGLLNEAIEIVNLFVDKDQLIVSTQSKIQKYNSVYTTRNPPLDKDIPLAVLINGRSASASEIVSGALQDLDRAVIIGSRSFGKGLVQRPKPLLYGTQVKITISRYFIPSGRGIQALDYQNRDAQGRATRLDEKSVRAFKTKNGRTVYDHGGIMPDFVIESQKNSPVTQALSASDIIFDFATAYYYDHPQLKTQDFQLQSKDLEAFNQFVKNRNFSFETQTEKAMVNLENAAHKDELNSDFLKRIETLKSEIQQSKSNLLGFAKEEISSRLTDEIVKRYTYREGLYDYYLTHDETILQARKVLLNNNQYQAVLQPN